MWIKLYTLSTILKILSFHSFKALHSTLARLHHRLSKSFNADTFFPTSVEVDMGRESVLRTLTCRNNITNSRIGNDLQFSSDNMTCWWVNRFGMFTLSWIRSISIVVKIRPEFIEIAYYISNWFVILITNNRQLRILKIIRYRWCNWFILKYTR